MQDVPDRSNGLDADSTLISAQTSSINKQGWYRVIFDDSYTAVPRRQVFFGGNGVK